MTKNNNKKITQADLETFINDLDKNPKCKNTKCCDGEGICISFDEIDKITKKK